MLFPGDTLFSCRITTSLCLLNNDEFLNTTPLCRVAESRGSTKTERSFAFLCLISQHWILLLFLTLLVCFCFKLSASFIIRLKLGYFLVCTALSCQCASIPRLSWHRFRTGREASQTGWLLIELRVRGAGADYTCFSTTGTWPVSSSEFWPMKKAFPGGSYGWRPMSNVSEETRVNNTFDSVSNCCFQAKNITVALRLVYWLLIGFRACVCRKRAVYVRGIKSGSHFTCQYKKRVLMIKHKHTREGCACLWL